MTPSTEARHAIEAARIVPVVALDDPADADPLGAALVAGGGSCVEVTFRTDAAATAIQTLVKRGDLLVGAGTVLTSEQVDAAVGAGARFVVSPGFDAGIVRRCRQLAIPVFPGAATATEIQQALAAGLDTVKFFPAEQLGGLAMIKALAGPFRSVKFIPTGGINADNLGDYLRHPSVLAVGGSWMVAPSLLAARRWDEVTRLTAAATAVARTTAAN